MVHLNVSLILAAIAVAPILANYGSPPTVLTTSSNVISSNSANSSGITKAIPAEGGTCKQDAEVPDTCDGSNDWYPLSVVGREGYYCTQGPICAGEIGSCPGPHRDLIFGSTCVSLSEGMNGCVPNTECPTTESTKLEADTPRAPSIAENCMVTPDTPSDNLSSGKLEETTYTPPEQTAQPTLQTNAPAIAPPTLEETPVVAQTPAMIPPTSTESGTVSLPLTIETESLTDIPTPYAASKPETQSASDGGLKEPQLIVNAGASTDVLTADTKVLFTHSEDASARSEGPLASTVTKAPYPTLTDAIETKGLAAVATEIDAPETDATDSDAPDSDAPEREVLTMSTLDDRRLRRN